MPILPPDLAPAPSDPSFTTLTEGQMAKADPSGKLVYAGVTVDPITSRTVFDNPIDVPAGSIGYGPGLDTSEGSLKLIVANNADGTHGYVITSEFDSAGSSVPAYVDLGAQFSNTLQPDDSQIITTNPLPFSIVGGVTPPDIRQTNQVTFRANASMPNVTAQITDNASGVVIRHIPSKAAFDAVTSEEVAANPGLAFIAGDNIVDFISKAPSTAGVFNVGISPFQLAAGQQIDIIFKADSMSLKGTATDIPFLTQLIQEGPFIDLARSGDVIKAQDTADLSGSPLTAIDDQISPTNLADVVSDGTFCVRNTPADVAAFGLGDHVDGDVLKKVGAIWKRLIRPVAGTTVVWLTTFGKPAIFFDEPVAGSLPVFVNTIVTGEAFSLAYIGTNLPGQVSFDGTLLIGNNAGGLTGADFGNTPALILGGSIPLWLRDTVNPERSGMYNLIVNNAGTGDYTLRRDYNFRASNSFTDGQTFFVGAGTGGDEANKNYLISLTQQFIINTTSLAIIEGTIANLTQVPSKATEEFAVTDARFFGELGLPASQQTWVDTATGSTTIDLVIENVFGASKQVVRHNDNFSDGLTTSRIDLTAQDWINANNFSASFGGVARLDTINGGNGFFSGFQVDAADNPLATGNRRYGINFNDNGGFLRLTEADNTGNNVTMDGTLGNPLVTFDEFFTRECLIPVGLGAAQMFINGDLTTFVPTFLTNTGGLGTRVIAGSGATSGIGRVVYHDNFGVTIYEDPSTKILTAVDLALDMVDVFVPGGTVDYTITLPTGVTRKQGATIVVFTQSVGTITFNSQDGKSLFNGLTTLVLTINKQQILTLTNSVDNSNIYSVETIEDSLQFAHSGVVSVALDSLTIVDVGPTTPIIRAKDIRVVQVRKRFDRTIPEILYMQPPQTDFAVPVGVNFIYVTAQGRFRFGSDAPTADAVTKETLIGKVVNPAGVITSLVFTPVTTPGSVIQKTELIEAGGRKLTTDGGTIIGGGAVNRTVQNVGKAFHEQLGRAIFSDPDASDRPFIPAIGIIGSVGSNSVLSTAHKLADESLSIDSFQVNAALPQIDTANFNSGGTLTLLTANKWVALHVIAFAQSNVFVFYTGLVEYGNQQLARDGFMSEDFEVLSGSLDGSHIGTLLCEANTTTDPAAFTANTIEFIARNGRRS